MEAEQCLITVAPYNMPALIVLSNHIQWCMRIAYKHNYLLNYLHNLQSCETNNIICQHIG